MNWKDFWDAKAKEASPFTQVGRVSGNKEHSPQTLGVIAANIKASLSLQPTDTLLDVCCGNGSITQRLAESCRKVTGIDFSEQLVAIARQQHGGSNITYATGNARTFSLAEQFDKACIYFAFQYFETQQEGEEVIANILRHLKPKATLLLGDVPDAARRHVFYNTPAKKLFYFKHVLTGKNTMGKFWSAAELYAVCRRLGVQGELLLQPAALPNAAYRFDFRIST